MLNYEQILFQIVAIPSKYRPKCVMRLITSTKFSGMLMHEQSGCSGNDADGVIPSLPCSCSQVADSPRFLMDGLEPNTEFCSDHLELMFYRQNKRKIPQKK